tara:strand:- start:245 stop:2128 length:1884 start_codon:yes stop_codon:yes gene_type:complete
MAEKIVSPGVFTKEIDASFLPSAVGEIGAAVIGPTVKGPALVPTVVTSYSEYQSIFGDVFKSGSNTYTYLTSTTAQSYLKHSGRLTVIRILDGTYNGASAFVPTGSGYHYSGSATGSNDANFVTQVAAGSSFKLNTIADGAVMNSAAGHTDDSKTVPTGSNCLLLSGSSSNLRWEVTSQNQEKGTFTLLIRRGDDTHKRKQILETWNNLSLDPNQPNYIKKMIGDSYADIAGKGTTDPYLTHVGQYPNKSKYVYVSDTKDTVDYLDENGDIRDGNASASLPTNGSGSYHGSFTGGENGYSGLDALGNVQGTYNSVKYNYYENISATNSQGYALSSTSANDGGAAYIDALNLLSNADEYDVNLILLPGVIDSLGNAHAGIVTKAIDVCESRGDCFLIYDNVAYSETNISNVTSKASERDTNYGATYWPWCQISEPETGAFRWVPPSSVLAGIYAFNDKIAAPWFAPAGLNRGGLDTVIQAARKLTHANRDDLYESNVNPIATFPGQGVCVWGQKTLQKKSSALDRVNVRRLMIKVKKFIAASSRYLVFEQNTAQTRERFLNIANPYLEQVQAQSGLNAFKVVMDETNNTPDVVDRNILYGQLFIQPTRTAEFIVLDFTIQPTGAAFPE